MTIAINLLFIILMMLFIPEKAYCKPEKIKYFLTKYEITEIFYAKFRSLNTENSWMFKAFGNEFIVDMYRYFHREDARISFISKLKNTSGTFLSSDYTLLHGFVRDANESFALGYFLNENQFRGYVGKDELYCIEPYESKVIVYRFKDIIVPGCQGEELDCTETKYFEPWKPNKPPPKPKAQKYSLYRNKNLEIFKELMAKYALKKTDHESNKKELKSRVEKAGSRHDDKNKTEHHIKFDDKKYASLVKESATLPKSSKNDREDKSKYAGKNNTIQDKNSSHCKHNKKQTDESNSLSSRNKTNEDSKDKINSGGKRKDRKERKRNPHSKGHGKQENDDDDELYSIQEYLKSQVHSLDPNENSISSKYDQNRIQNNTQPAFNPISLKEINEIWKLYSHIANDNEEQKYKYVENNEDSPREMKQGDETLNLQCNIEIVTSPSFFEKFARNSEYMLKDIYTQITLLNRIFSKVPLIWKNEPFQLFFRIQQITIYGDVVYSPFMGDGDSEYFAKNHLQFLSNCLSIGFVNEFLRSGQFFDGYIPQGGGGICAGIGNNVMVSHGNDNTPAPMGLFFASLVRAVTRAFGANDEDSKCDEGTYPNPMLVLQQYILDKEIQPEYHYSIFTKCNIKEIDLALMSRDCLEKVSDPLCGNGIVDEGEKCDCGPAYHCDRVDPCCTPPVIGTTLQERKQSKRKGCALNNDSECGSSEECCVNCLFNKEKKRCYSGPRACDIALCDGKSGKCPSGPEASNGLICSKFNESNPFAEPLMCKDGNCDQPLCSSFDLKPCSCAVGTNRDCVYCCLSKNGKCKSAGEELNLVKGRKYLMENGVECMGGICMDGKCIPESDQELLNFSNIVKPPRYPTVQSSGHWIHEMTAVFLALVLAFLLIK